MRKHRGQRGEGNAGCLFGLIVLAIVGYLAYKMIPVKVKAADLKQTVTDEAKMAGTHGDNVIVGQILETARKNNLPITADNVKINRTQAEIRVDVDYDVPIDFPGKTWNWHQHVSAENPIF